MYIYHRKKLVFRKKYQQLTFKYQYIYSTGTGIVASSGTPTHLGKVIGDMFRMLHAVEYGTEALVYINYQRKLLLPSCIYFVFTNNMF